MADVKISALTDGTVLADADESPVVQGGVTKRISEAERAGSPPFLNRFDNTGKGFKPTAAAFETIPRFLAGQNSGTALTSGTLRLQGMYLPKGTIISNITFVAGAQLAVVPTNQWFALFDSSLILLALTTDDTGTGWSASAKKTLSIATGAGGAISTYTTLADGFYYLGIMVAAATVPSLIVDAPAAVNTSVWNLAPEISSIADSGLTTRPAFPFTATRSAIGPALIYGYVA